MSKVDIVLALHESHVVVGRVVSLNGDLIVCVKEEQKRYSINMLVCFTLLDYDSNRDVRWGAMVVKWQFSKCRLRSGSMLRLVWRSLLCNKNVQQLL